MDTLWKTIVWPQFGAALDMLENAMRACPEELWRDASSPPKWKSDGVVGFWYVAYHTLFFLDYYLSDPSKEFAPPPPFTLDELDPAGLLPPRAFQKHELLMYLDFARAKCRRAITGLTEESAARRCGFERPQISTGELVLYSMRHVQHHTGQLNLMLREASVDAPRWVARARN